MNLSQILQQILELIKRDYVSLLPRRISKEISVVFVEEGLDSSPVVAQAERRAVAGVAHSVVRPRQDDVPQGLQRGLKILGRPGFAGATFKGRVADDDAVVIFEGEADHIGDVTGGVVDSQGVFAHAYQVTVVEPTVGVQDHAFKVRAGVSHHRDIQPRSHLLQCADVVGVGVGDEDADGVVVGQHLQQRLWLGARVNEDALPGGGADQNVGVHRPGADAAGSQFQFCFIGGHKFPLVEQSGPSV